MDPVYDPLRAGDEHDVARGAATDTVENIRANDEVQKAYLGEGHA